MTWIYLIDFIIFILFGLRWEYENALNLWVKFMFLGMAVTNLIAFLKI